MRVYTAPKTLIVDKFGYLPLTRTAATMFLQLVSAPSGKGSITLTSNKSFVEWRETLGDTVVATAILGRLLHHSRILSIRGSSYRLRDRQRAGLVVRSARETQAKEADH